MFLGKESGSNRGSLKAMTGIDDQFEQPVVEVNMTGTQVSPEILIVEDNLGDARLISSSFTKLNSEINTVIVEDGAQAMEYLKTSIPDLIILDLNLPKVDGHTLLAWKETQSDIRQIPVVVFTSSRAGPDIAKAYSLRCNCYLNKPLDLIQFRELMKSVYDFWFAYVVLPTYRLLRLGGSSFQRK